MTKHTIKLNCKQVRRSKPLPELSASEVRQMVSGVISEYFGLQADGYSCSTEVVNDVVIKASVEGESIESTCQDLDAVPTGHTVRDYLNEQLPTENLGNIEEQVNAALTTDLPKPVFDTLQMVD
jgi:hypothetical protein